MSDTQNSPTTLTCCFEGCETQLAVVSGNQAKALRPHIICETCRSILICQDHYRLLRNSGHTTCPACNSDNWRHIREDEPEHLPIRINQLWRFDYAPVYIDDIPASAKLDYRGVSLMPTATGARLDKSGSRHSLQTSAPILDFDVFESNILYLTNAEQHRLTLDNFDSPFPNIVFRSVLDCNVQRIRWVDASSFVCLASNVDGLIDIWLFSILEEGRYRGRCAIKTQTQSADFERMIFEIGPAQTVWLSSVIDGISILTCYALDTGLRQHTVELRSQPLALRSSSDGYIATSTSNGDVLLIKNGRMVPLFETISCIDFVFPEPTVLLMLNAYSATYVNLESGESDTVTWQTKCVALSTFNGSAE